MFNTRTSERRDVHKTYTRMLAFLEDYGLPVDLDLEMLAMKEEDSVH